MAPFGAVGLSWPPRNALGRQLAVHAGSLLKFLVAALLAALSEGNRGE